MCGIVGYAGFTKRISLESAIAAIRHRGPDDNGVAYFNGVALGNVRLAIIDLSPKGHQPIFSRDKSLCITYNGEIYNFKEVKRLLEKKYTFTTQTDTEIILYAYQEWGTKCLQKLNGMFAFVIYDRKKQILFGARDRLGQKPLKYYFENGRFVFASEIKAILSLMGEAPTLDEVALDNFLTFQYVPSPRTGFQKIYKLPAGHYFIYKNKKLATHRYWSPNFAEKLQLSEHAWEETIYEGLTQAVQSHLVSDVEVGALLSGGLDSSIVVALMAKLSSRRIQTFSIGFDDEKFDESPFAKLVSRRYNTKHNHLFVTSHDLMKNITNLVKYYDEPIADNSILPTLLISKLVGSKVKVALTGDGGDENFGGYDRYAIVSLAALLTKSPSLLKKTMRISTKMAFSLRPSKLTERADRFLMNIDEKFYRRYVDYNSFFTRETKQRLYTQDFARSVKNNDSMETYNEYFDSRLDDLDNALKIDVRTYLPDDLLYKTDIASMAYGVELRSPFLDHVFMQKIAQMPSQMKVALLTKKKMLKRIAATYNLVPEAIINRKKQGFTIPQNAWFKGPLKKYLRNQILSSGMVDTIFDKRMLELYTTDYFTSNLNYDNNMFALLMLSQWFEKYVH